MVSPARSSLRAIVPSGRNRARLRALRSAVSERRASLHVEGTDVETPPELMAVVDRALEYLASGEPVMIIPANEELTTGEAATILGFSRQYLVRLLDEGQIPFRREGAHRRLLLRDVIRFRERRNAQQRVAVRDMIQHSQSVGAYDWTEEDVDALSTDADPADTS